MELLILDIEIAKAISPKDEPKIEEIDYCEGWKDFTKMGIAYIGFWTPSNGYHYYHGSQKKEIARSIQGAERIVTFNGNAFDRQLLLANDIDCPETYDLLEEIREASGQPRRYVKGITIGGYSLSAIAKANDLEDKKGSGLLAPIWYQQGNLERLIKYLKHDLYLTKEIYLKRNCLIDPTNGKTLELEKKQEELLFYKPEDLII